jgi:hypothetical protein
MGSLTETIIYALDCHGDREAGAQRYSHYAYTDISPRFFEEAKELFKDFADGISFTTLDIEHALVQQGYEAESYDLILAPNVITASKA